MSKQGLGQEEMMDKDGEERKWVESNALSAKGSFVQWHLFGIKISILSFRIKLGLILDSNSAF